MMQNVWIPNLRGIPLGLPGETVAEFNVKTPESTQLNRPEVTSSAKVKKHVSNKNKNKNKDKKKPKPDYGSGGVSKPASLCPGADTAIELYAGDEFVKRQMRLEEAAPVIGLFGVDFR